MRETLERFANEQWLPVHVTREEAAAIALDQFKRAIAANVGHGGSAGTVAHPPNKVNILSRELQAPLLSYFPVNPADRKQKCTLLS